MARTIRTWRLCGAWVAFATLLGPSLASALAPRSDPAARLAEARALLDRAEEMAAEVSGPPGVDRSLLESARATLGRAADALAAGRVDRADSLMWRARAEIRGGVSERIRSARTPVRLADAIASVEALEREALNLASACDDPTAKRLVERARGRLRLARDRLAEGRLEEAAAQAYVARALYGKVNELCAR